MKVFDLIEREMARIVSENMSAGSYSKQWNTVGLPNGVYYYQLDVGSFMKTDRLILLR
ncbi:MAG: hypothetical protein ABSC53_11570 [Bacteroidota bacterium]